MLDSPTPVKAVVGLKLHLNAGLQTQRDGRSDRRQRSNPATHFVKRMPLLIGLHHKRLGNVRHRRVAAKDRYCVADPIETRKIDIPRLTPPTWQSVLDHEYEAWESDPFNIDTALTSPAQAVAMITERFLSKE